MQLDESIDQDDIPIPHDFEVEPFGLFILSPSPEIYQPSAEFDIEYAPLIYFVSLFLRAVTDSM